MSLIRILVYIAAVCVCVPQVMAQVVSSRGMATLNYEGFRLNAETRAQAVKKAQGNALEAHIAESGAAKLRLFEQRRDEFLADIDRYVLSSVTLSEQEDKKAKTYSVVIRAEINATLLQTKLDAGSAVAGVTNAETSLLTFVFVARSQDSVQSFDDRVYKRAETTSTYDGKVSQGDSYTEKTREGEAFTNNSISTSGSRDVTQVNRTQIDEKASASIETGGSTTQKSDKVFWKVSNASEVNTVVTGLFSAAGYEVAEAEYVEGVNLESIRKDFGTGNDLSPATLRAAANGIRAADVRYLAYGTLDVGVRDRDPVSGNVRVHVTVTGKVLDVSKSIPRVVSSVGPVQYAGMGPNETVARTNALQDAASKAAQQMANELNVKSVR